MLGVRLLRVSFEPQHIEQGTPNSEVNNPLPRRGGRRPGWVTFDIQSSLFDILRFNWVAGCCPPWREVADDGYRKELKKALPPLLAKWEPLIGVEVERFFAQRMKTKWGSCNPRARSIRLNTDLAKKPRECLEYVVVHEMVHILESTHNAHFVALMDRAMPQWRVHKEQLNRLPISHGAWGY